MTAAGAPPPDPARAPSRLRHVLVNRHTPFAVVVVLSASSPALPHRVHPNTAWWGAAGAVLAVTFGLMWTAAQRPRWRWPATAGPILFVVAVQFLRNSDGNATAGFTSLLYLPVIWFALYGRRYQLALAIAGAWCVQILPIVIVGAPQYPASAWRGTVLFLLVLSTVGPLVQFLLRRSAEATAALAVSESQFRAAFDDAPVGTMLSRIGGSGDRRILNVNRALCTMLGRPAEQLVGREVYEFIHPDDLEAARQRRRLLAEGGRVPPTEMRLMHASGRSVWASISFSLIRRDDGTPLHIISQAEDITARLAADRALLDSLAAERQAAELARAAAKARRDMVSAISHDLRSPITSAAGFVELLGEGDAGPLTPEQRTMLDTVRRNLQRIASIVEDLLTLSRTDHETMPRAEPIDIGEVVDAAVRSISLQVGERGLRLQYRNQLDGVRVSGDASRLDRALANLLSNALKFTPAGGTVRVHACASGPAVTIEVADTGIGIPPEDVDRIFEQYFRSSSARDQAPGTGLGLAIVQAVAEQHGGTVTVRSDVGAGCTFTLTLPATS